MTQPLSYADIEFYKITSLEITLATRDDTESGYSIELVLKHPQFIEKQQKT